MLKNILEQKGVKSLTKKEQKNINGGYACKLEQDGSYSCPPGTYCETDGVFAGLCRLN